MYDDESDLNENVYLRTQTIGFVQAVADVFYDVLENAKPLDKALKYYFHQHPQCGARDRSFISESCFSLFRWYGWMRERMPNGCPQPAHESTKFCHALAASLWLDQQDELAFYPSLLELAEVDESFMQQAPDDLAGKIKGLGHFFKIRKLNVESLLPEWTAKVIPQEADLTLMSEVMQQRPPVWIRLQKLSLARVRKEFEEQDIVFEEHPRCLHALKILSPKFNMNTSACYQSGDFEIQDLASQCIGRVCDAHDEQHWLDLCGGAGGKALLLADALQGKGRVVVTDTREKILEQVVERVKRARFKNLEIVSYDDLNSQKELFDGVLVDAPCSCTGIWRRNPDLRWTTKVEACLEGSKIQLEICDAAAEKVKVGGVLVYATCSFSVVENENVVNQFLEQHSNFVLENFLNPLNGENVEGVLRIDFKPFDNDAMFVAKFKRVKDKI